MQHSTYLRQLMACPVWVPSLRWAYQAPCRVYHWAPCHQERLSPRALLQCCLSLPRVQFLRRHDTRRSLEYQGEAPSPLTSPRTPLTSSPTQQTWGAAVLPTPSLQLPLPHVPSPLSLPTSHTIFPALTSQWEELTPSVPCSSKGELGEPSV